MKRFVAIAAAICTAAALSGCAGLTTLLTAPASKDSTMGQAILQHLELCKRTYRGAIGVGVTGSFDIECPAQPAPAIPGLSADAAMRGRPTS
jgi:predicted NBD/HSP70 family sugar kinase